MDHLPCPASAIGRAKIAVPYVCEKGYDGGDFMTYPSRRSGSLPNLPTVGHFPGQLLYSHQMHLASLSKHEIESFYQTWLFFGLIHEILGSLYVAKDLVYTWEDAGHYSKALSTSKLIITLDEWVARVQAGTVEPPLTYAHVAQCLCLTHAALSVPAVRSKFDPNLMLSLASLGQTLTYAADKAFNITDLVQDNKCPRTWCQLLDGDYWQGRLLPQGWCATEIKLILDTTMSLQTLHFLACLDKTESERSHQGCDSRQCTAYQNDLGSYQTQHVRKECNCEELSIESEALYNILKTGALPLIRVRPGQTLGELSVDIVASRSTSRYVALSHVWADGLGNPYVNALPRCQLSNLGRFIQDLDMAACSRDTEDHGVKEKNVAEKGEEILLWCDTLCCPVQPKKAKHLALEYMYRTYRNATHVLVLDACLRQYNVESLDIDEVSMSILTSPWMRRLWTLQEGALPAVTNRLWFQLAHKAVNLRELRINARDKIFSSISRRGLGVDMFKRLYSFANVFRDNSISPRGDLGKVIEALHHRSVSILSDEPLLIGNLLGLDTAQILNGGDGAVALRMNRLWRLMPSAGHGIPSDLLFRLGPRLAEPGLRWAPATLLTYNDANIFIQSSEKEQEQAFLTPSDGLLVRLHGFRLSLASRAIGLPSLYKSISQLDNQNRLWMKDDAGSWYSMRRSLPVDQESFLTNNTLAEIAQEGKNMWVIHPGSKFPRQPDSKAPSSVGLIVEVETETEAEAEAEAEEEVATVKKTCAKLHINIAPVQRSMQAYLASAAVFSAQLASASPALRKLAAIENDLDEHQSSSSFTTTLEEIASEIHQMANNEDVKEAIEATGNIFYPSMMDELIMLVLWGQYVCMGETAPRTQRWCVD